MNKDNYKVCFIIAHKYFREYPTYIQIYVDNIFKFYSDAFVLIINNNSDNINDINITFKKYANLAIIENISESKYELGAFTFGINWFNDNNLLSYYDYYIFTQDTFILSKKYDFDYFKNNNIECSSIVQHDYVRSAGDSVRSTYLIPEMEAVLRKIGINNSINVPICWGNNLICSKTKIHRLFNYLKQITIKTKKDSEVAERYMGRIIYELNNQQSFAIDGYLEHCYYDKTNAYDINFDHNNMQLYFQKKHQYKLSKPSSQLTLPNIKKSKIGIIYVYYQRINEQKNQTNLSYFFKYGLVNNKWLNLDTETLIVINGHLCDVIIPNKPNIHILKRENSTDFEGWFEGMNYFINKYEKPIWEIFDYLFLINSSTLGPIYEPNINDHWLIPFYDKMVKYNACICSPCLSFLPESNPGGVGPRIVSSVFLLRCTKHIYELLTKEVISAIDDTSVDNFYKNHLLELSNTYHNTVFGKKYNKHDTVLTGEYGLSRLLIRNGYKVTCLLYDFDCHDEKYWNINNYTEPDRFNTFNGICIPLSTIFVKNIWRWGISYCSVPLLYNECMNYINSKLLMHPLINYDVHTFNQNDFNFNIINIHERDIQWNNWHSKQEYYIKYGHAEQTILFPNVSESCKDVVIYVHSDPTNVIKDYVLQGVNALLSAGFNILFFTSCPTITNINTFPVNITYNCENAGINNWKVWYEGCKYLTNSNINYENILFLDDSLILPINGINNFKEILDHMRTKCHFWSQWESYTINTKSNIITCPFEIKSILLHRFQDFIERNKSEDSQFFETNLVNFMINKGYKYDVIINSSLLDNTVNFPILNPINIYKWINNKNTFAIKWEYTLSYIKPELVSNELNYLTRFLYYGKYGIVSEYEKNGYFIKSSCDL